MFVNTSSNGALEALASEKKESIGYHQIWEKKGEWRHQRGTEILITFEQFHRTGGGGGGLKKSLGFHPPTHIQSATKLITKIV